MFGLGLWSIFILVLSVGSILAMFAYMATGHEVRYDEEAARDFYDRHGHWPDQTAEEAEAERAAAEHLVRVPTTRADTDGTV